MCFGVGPIRRVVCLPKLHLKVVVVHEVLSFDGFDLPGRAHPRPRHHLHKTTQRLKSLDISPRLLAVPALLLLRKPLRGQHTIHRRGTALFNTRCDVLFSWEVWQGPT